MANKIVDIETEMQGFIRCENCSGISKDNIGNDKCTRFVRKKFKCIMLFLIALIALIQLMDTAFSKIDLNTTKSFLNRFSNVYGHLNNSTE